MPVLGIQVVEEYRNQAGVNGGSASYETWKLRVTMVL